MKSPVEASKRTSVARIGLAVAVVLAVVLAMAYLVAPTHAASGSGPIGVASGSSQQWAFGGTASASYSCTSASCGANSTISSVTLRYYVEWVVIYTATNISSTQTEFEVQAALNASVSASVVEGSLSASASLSGKETESGFTNVTSAGSVDLTSGPGSPANVSALAIQNANSNAAFNISGSFSETNGSVSVGSFSFDFGGSEASSVSFSSPLGLVPVNPAPNDNWTASAPYSATASGSVGYSISASYDGQSETENNWTGLSVSPSGTLFVNGTDLGAVTLYDNYTSPPTTVTAQAILLSFSNGEFGASDGFLMLPDGLYGGLDGIGGLGLIAGQHPAQSDLVSSSESAYYQTGVGFIGSGASESGSSLGLTGTGSQFSVTASPEPVSVAQAQYSSITSGSGASSSFPWIWAVLGVVVVIVVIVALLFVRRSRRRPTAAAPAAPAAAPAEMSAAPTGPEGAPAAMAPAPMAAAAPTGAAAAVDAPVCPTCGQQSTYIAQYGRYYCYTDKQYL
jgi:hypothetical protein